MQPSKGTSRIVLGVLVTYLLSGLTIPEVKPISPRLGFALGRHEILSYMLQRDGLSGWLAQPLFLTYLRKRTKPQVSGILS